MRIHEVEHHNLPPSPAAFAEFLHLSPELQSLELDWYITDPDAEELILFSMEELLRLLSLPYLHDLRLGPGLYGSGDVVDEFFKRHPRIESLSLLDTTMAPVFESFFCKITPGALPNLRVCRFNNTSNWTDYLRALAKAGTPIQELYGLGHLDSLLDANGISELADLLQPFVKTLKMVGCRRDAVRPKELIGHLAQTFTAVAVTLDDLSWATWPT
jgi:hypothetical protein